MWHRSIHAWESPQFPGRPMDLVVHGHAGARVLVFPTSMGRFHEWEDRGMCEAVGDQLEVLVDGGVRSGLDVVKFLALGLTGTTDIANLDRSILVDH